MTPIPQNAMHPITREEFRRTTRQVLQAPTSLEAHHNRLRAAQKIPGSEPLQAAFVDMLCSVPPVSTGALEWLRDPASEARLAAHVREALLGAASASAPMTRVNPLATRWCVIAVPSCNVPERARLSSADDSRAMAAQAVQQATAGNDEALNEFLGHCVGTQDKLAFMLAFTALSRDGVALTQDWYRVMTLLQEKQSNGKAPHHRGT